MPRRRKSPVSLGMKERYSKLKIRELRKHNDGYEIETNEGWFIFYPGTKEHVKKRFNKLVQYLMNWEESPAAQKYGAIVPNPGYSFSSVPGVGFAKRDRRDVDDILRRK